MKIIKKLLDCTKWWFEAWALYIVLAVVLAMAGIIPLTVDLIIYMLSFMAVWVLYDALILSRSRGNNPQLHSHIVLKSKKSAE